MARKLQHDVGKDQRGRLLIDAYITLVESGDTRAEDTNTDVIATVTPIGRDEYAAAGEKGMKARYMFEVYANEYANHDVVLYNDERLVVYRTYGPKANDKVEIYAGQRVGNR